MFVDFAEMRKLKPKQAITQKRLIFEEQIADFLLTMFEYNNLFCDKIFLETILLQNGKCAVWRLPDDGEIVVTECDFIGNIDAYGIGCDLFCVTKNGKSRTFTDWQSSSDVVVIFNDSNRSKDFNVHKFADLFEKTHTTTETLILNSRLNKMIFAENDLELAEVKKALENGETGKPFTVGSKTTLGDSQRAIFDLTDVNSANNLQYLSQFHTDLIKRLCNIYGLSTQGNNKLAQMTTAEVNNGSGFSFIIPLDRLQCRAIGVDKINEFFGTEITVRLNPILERELKGFFYNEREKTESEVEFDETSEVD